MRQRKGRRQPTEPLQVWVGAAVTEETLTLMKSNIRPDAWEIDDKYDGDLSMPGPRRVLIDANLHLDLMSLDEDVNAAIKKLASLDS